MPSPPRAPFAGLIEGKFVPQLTARALVNRARLALPEGLLQGTLKAATLVAPGGYGKSTLMGQWYATASDDSKVSHQFAWLSLDENDNDPERLLRYLYGSLGQFIPSLTAEAVGQLARTQNMLALLEGLSIRLAEHEFPIILFLDDVHVITHPAAVQLLEWLLRHGGAQLRFVLGSRHAITLGLAALHLRGLVIEFDQRALAFDGAEANCFCATRVSNELDSKVLDALLKKTEGWPAGMELLSLALNDATDDSRLISDFTTTQRGVFDYLSDVVFGQLPDETRTVIHQLAQFDRFSADLIAAAIGHSAPEKLLADLQWRHLFLIPLDRQGRWFRFHHLVSEYLRRQNPQSEADTVATLAAGGTWLFAQGMTDDAIDCAVRARQWDLACRWLLSAAEDTAQRLGIGANLLRWMPLIPREFIDRYPQIRLSYVFSLAFKQSADEIQRELAELDALIQRFASEPDADIAMLDHLRSAASAQRMLWDALSDEATHLLERTESWIAEWPNASARYSGDVYNIAAFACKTTGDIDKGLDYCARAQRIQRTDNGQFAIAWNLVVRALLQLKRGDFRAAQDTAEEGLRHVAEKLYGHPEPTATFHTLLAVVSYEFDDTERASQELDYGLDAFDETGVADIVLLTYLTRARLQFKTGQPDTGLSALALGRKLGQRRKLSRVRVGLAGEECVWLCRLDRMDAALELARAQGFDRSVYPRYDAVADKAMRVAPRLLMAEQPEMAIALLSPGLVRASEKGFHHRRVELLILQAAALLRVGRTTEAFSSWSIALELGERFGYRRVFLDDMDIVTSLAHAARDHTGITTPAWLKASPEKVRNKFDEALTRKELRILKLLESGSRNREIAESLFVSEGTLKWHLHNIYRKLECKNRSGAIVAARRKALL